MNSGFIKSKKGIKLNLTSYTKEKEVLNYISLLGRVYRLKKMLEKREKVIKEWKDDIKSLIIKDIENIQSEISERIGQLNNISNNTRNKKEIYKVRLDVFIQKNGSKFYRGRINIPKTDRDVFKLKQPRKEFLIKRNEVRILVRKINNQKMILPVGIINKPTFIINGIKLTDSTLGREFQYLVYEKYINYLKNRINIK